jgi:protein SCO1/2
LFYRRIKHNIMKRKSGLIILILLLAIPAIWVVLWKNTQFGYNELPIFSTDEMGEQVPYLIDSFSLLDQNGNVFTRDSIGDKIFIASFFFASCPDVCPTINGHLKIATDRLKNSTDVMFLTHSVDPYNDSVAVLNQYAKDYEADYNQWRFLTGSKSTIYHLARDSYKSVIQEVPDTNAFIHSEKLVLVDKEFHVRGIYDGLDIKEVLNMVEDARFLLMNYMKEENEQ